MADEELLLRAAEALASGALTRAAHLLEAVQQQDTPQWNLLRGKICLRQKKWKTAEAHLRTAETEFPREVWSGLETCYRELGNYQKAYEYACKQRI